MKVLGLDIASVTGWCLRDAAGSYQTGEWDFKPLPPSKNRPKEPEGVRFRRLHDQLHLFLTEHPIGVVIIEEGFSKSKRGWQVAGGLIAAAEIALEVHELPYLFLNASSLKKFARDNSKRVRTAFETRQDGAEKEAMRLVAGSMLEKRALTDNEADAFWLVKWWEENVTHLDLYGQGTLKL